MFFPLFFSYSNMVYATIPLPIKVTAYFWILLASEGEVFNFHVLNSSVAWVFWRSGQETKLAPLFLIFFLTNFQIGSSKTNLGQFQKWRARKKEKEKERKKKKGPQFVFIHLQSFIYMYLTTHLINFSMTNWQGFEMVGLFCLMSGQFSAPQVVPGVRAPSPLPPLSYATGLEWYNFIKFCTYSHHVKPISTFVFEQRSII